MKCPHCTFIHAPAPLLPNNTIMAIHLHAPKDGQTSTTCICPKCVREFHCDLHEVADELTAEMSKAIPRT